MKGAIRQRGDLRREEQGFGGSIENSGSRDRGKLSSGREDEEGVGRWYTGEDTEALTRYNSDGKRKRQEAQQFEHKG